jgi:hypothetical protein
MGTPKVPRLFPPSRWVAREGAKRGADAPPVLCGMELLTGGVVVDMVKDDRFFFSFYARPIRVGSPGP